MKTKHWIHPDIYTSVFLIVIAAVFIGNSFTYPSADIGMFPNLFAVILILTTLPTLIKAIKKTVEVNRAGTGADQKSDYAPRELPQALLGFVLLVVYALGIQFIGFYVSTALFFAGMMFLLKVKKKYLFFVMPVLADLLVYFLMSKLLGVVFPQGLLF